MERSPLSGYLEPIRCPFRASEPAAASNSFGMTVTPAGLRSAAEIEPALRAFAKEPNGGLIVAPSPFNTTNQELIIVLASELRLPAIYPFRYFTENGGLASYVSIRPNNIGVLPHMSTAPSEVKSRMTCRYRRQRSMTL